MLCLWFIHLELPGYISHLTLSLGTPDRVIIRKDLGLLLLTLYIYKHIKWSWMYVISTKVSQLPHASFYSLASECPFKCMYIHKALNIFALEVQMFWDITLLRGRNGKSQNNTSLTILKQFVSTVAIINTLPSPQVFVITLINLLLMITVVSTNTAFPLSALVLLTSRKCVRHDEIRQRNGENYSSKNLGWYSVG